MIIRKAGKWLSWVVVAGIIIVAIAPAISLLTKVQDREAIKEQVDSIGLWGPVILISAIVLQIVIAVIPGHFLGVASGYIYGFVPGFLLLWLTVVITGQALFYVARIYGKPVVYRLTPDNLIDKWEKIAKRQGIVFYAFSFVLPIFPADLMVYVAGLSKISARNFFFAQVLGRIPGAAMMNAAGAYGFELSSEWLIVILIVSAILFAVWLKYGQELEEKVIKPKAEAG